MLSIYIIYKLIVSSNT
ncbi:hypothetical protein ACSLOK_07680 [Escherichia coli]